VRQKSRVATMHLTWAVFIAAMVHEKKCDSARYEEMR
jgi:hypothetical protein